jgi:hypothetical protein
MYQSNGVQSSSSNGVMLGELCRWHRTTVGCKTTEFSTVAPNNPNSLTSRSDPWPQIHSPAQHARARPVSPHSIRHHRQSTTIQIFLRLYLSVQAPESDLLGLLACQLSQALTQPPRNPLLADSVKAGVRMWPPVRTIYPVVQRSPVVSISLTVSPSTKQRLVNGSEEAFSDSYLARHLHTLRRLLDYCSVIRRISLQLSL